MMAGFIADLRHAFRIYLKTPWQSALAIVMLASAMALVAAMANLWSELHLAGTPGLENDRGLVTIGLRAEMRRGVLNGEALKEFSQATQTLERVSGASMFNFVNDLDMAGEPVEGNVEPVMPGYFETLRPIITRGRGLIDADFSGDGARVLVLSHRLWQEHFDGDAGIVGSDIDIKGEPWRVVGVTHPDFTGITTREPLFWLPSRRYFLDFQSLPDQFIDQFPFWQVVGRMAPGVSVAAVDAEVRGFVEQFPFPEMGRQPDPEQILILDGIVHHPQAREQARRQTTLLLAAAVLVAAVAAVNIGIFLLARAPGRRRELALRQAVGAGRRRLAGQLLVEAALLVAAASVAGIVLSIWLAAFFRELAFLANAGFAGDVLNWPALGFSTVLAAVFTVLVALVPIGLLRGRRLSQEGRQISARPGLFQHTAGLIQLSLAGLVGAAALGFVMHLWLMTQNDPGFDSDGVQVATLGFKERPTGRVDLPSGDLLHAYREDVRRTLGALPGVEQISFASPLPGQQMMTFGRFDIDGEQIEPRMVSIAPGFMDLLGIRLLAGNGPERDDTMGVIVSREFAERAWGTTDVVDRFLVDADGEDPDEHWRVIGVAEDVSYAHPDDPPEPLLFSASSRMFAEIMSAVLVRGSADPDLLADRLDEVLERHVDILQVNEVELLADIVARLTAADRARALVTGLFGVVILLMAGFGFFAIQRFLVDAGLRETAVRMALGAGPKRIRRHVLAQGLKLGLPGLAIGALLAVITAAWLTDDLISANVSAIAVAVAVTGMLLVLMVGASMQPALRAARLKPGDLLKEE